MCKSATNWKNCDFFAFFLRKICGIKKFVVILHRISGTPPKIDSEIRGKITTYFAKKQIFLTKKGMPPKRLIYYVKLFSKRAPR